MVKSILSDEKILAFAVRFNKSLALIVMPLPANVPWLSTLFVSIDNAPFCAKMVPELVRCWLFTMANSTASIVPLLVRLPVASKLTSVPA